MVFGRLWNMRICLSFTQDVVVLVMV
ncbi:hypothetical protein LINGRAHAP2_LOCUS23749 [Linum grandiflorum]